MKKHLWLTTTLSTLMLTTAFAQFGPGGGSPQGPDFSGALDHLFGTNQAFSARLEFQTIDAGSNTVIMPGQLSFDHGKTRFEMNTGELQAANLPPDFGAMMKSLGMDTMITLSRPDKKFINIIYPGLHSFVEMPSTDASTNSATADAKVETTALGREAVDGHDCVKNQVTVTDPDGTRHASTVWNAADLKNFPVKIVTTDQGQNSTLRFKNISFEKPAADSFEAPAGLTKYDSLQTMMQTEMMKHLGGGAGAPPGQ